MKKLFNLNHGNSKCHCKYLDRLVARIAIMQSNLSNINSCRCTQFIERTRNNPTELLKDEIEKVIEGLKTQSPGTQPET